MAVDNPVQYHVAWVYLRDSMGLNYGGANDKQKHNAELFYNLLRVFGYTQSSACGILGNMQVESGLSPGSLTGAVSQLPNNGEHLSDLPNSVMFNWNGSYTHDTGLISWAGNSNVDGGNVVASFAIRYDLNWYDWELQLFRLQMEYIYDPSGYGGVNGTTYNFWYPVSGTAVITWANYMTYTGTPEQSADYFREYRERSSGDPDGNQHRRDNARYWYNYFNNYSVTTEVSATLNACMAYLFRDSGYLYTQYVDGRQMDCIGFVNFVRKRLGIPYITNGTNSLWRSPYPGELTWKGTLQECLDLYGAVPQGAYLFKCYPEGSAGYNPPAQYWGDGIGDFNHIGIFTDLGKTVMQSGGYDITPQYGGINGVHDSYFEPQQPVQQHPWWTHVAFGRNIKFQQGSISGSLPTWMYPLILNRKKVLGRERKFH